MRRQQAGNAEDCRDRWHLVGGSLWPNVSRSARS